MSRELNIGMKLDEKPVITSLNKIQEAFEKLNAVKEEIAPKGKMKIDIDTGDTKDTLKEIVKSLSDLNKTMKELYKNSKKTSDGVDDLGDSAKSATGDILAFITSLRIVGNIANWTSREFINLTNNTFGVGVASQMTVKQIAKLNSEFSKLATKSPISSVEMSKAVDDLIRTGKSYEDSMKIIAETAKLAVASGDSLAHTAEVATKIIVSLGLKSENTSEALGSLHSVAIQTASSMGSLSEAYKNYAGTLGVFANSSGRAGKELDEYKQKLLDLGLASSGVLANLGLTSSQQGTKIKVFFSKLIGLEQSAIKLFNKDMATAGVDMSAEKLAELAKSDLPKAIEVLSKLNKEGLVSTETLKKMFTGRHFTEIMAILRAVDGDVNKFSESLTKGVSYMADYNKQMYNLTNQFKQFQNVTFNMTRTMSDFVTSGLTGVLMGFNELSNIQLPLFITNMGSGILTLSSFTAGFVGLAGVIYKFTSVLKPLLTTITMGALSNPIALGATAIVSSLLLLGKTYKDMKVENDSMLQSFDKNSSTFNKLQNSITSTKAGIDSTGDAFKLLSEEIQSAYNTAGGDFAKKLGLTNETLNIIRGMQELLSNPIDLNIKTNVEQVKTQLDEIILKRQGLTSERDEIINRIRAKAKGSNYDFETGIETGYDYTDFINKVLDPEFMKKNKLSSADELIDYINKGKGIFSKLGISDRSTINSIFSSDFSSLNKSTENIEILEKEISSLNEIKGATDEIVNKQSEIYKKMGASFKLEEMEETIKYFNEFNKTITGKEGWDAIGEIAMDSFKDSFKEDEIKRVKDNIQKEFEKMNISIDFKDTEIAKRLVSMIGKSLGIENLLQNKDKIGALDEENYKSSVRHAENLVEIDKKFIETKTRLNKENKSSRNYEIKYVNILKETLSLEAERLKLGKTKEEQERIAYQYRLKQYKLDIDLAKRDSNVLSQNLGKYGLSSFIGATPQQIQAEIERMVTQKPASLKNDEGALYKDKYNALVAYGKAVSEVYKLENKYNTEIAGRNVQMLNQYRDSMLEIVQLRGGIGYTLKSMLGLEDTSEIDATIESLKMRIGYLTQDIAKSFGSDLTNIMTAEQGQELLAKEQARLANMKEGTNEYSIQLNKIDSIIDLTKMLSELEDDNIKKKLRELEIIRQQAQSYEKIGSLLKSVESNIGLKGLGQVGDIFSGLGGFSSLSSRSKALNKEYGSIFKNDGKSTYDSLKSYFDSEAFRSSMDTAIQGVDFGSAIGSLVGGITGGGKSSQSAGALGGMIGGLMGMSNPATLALSTGMSLLGGLFNKKGDEAKAQKFNAEQKKIFDANTEALNKLANNMSSLGGIVDSLNSMLISNFSKLPTVGNLTRVTDSMKSMAKTLEATRRFENASYQITRRKKGKKGFMGIGSTADTTWTETYGVSVQELLGKYGFKGTIEDMTTQQMRDFSKWLDKFNMGEADNFSALAKAIESYAQSLDQMNINIDRFFYDATMEGFQGISSLQQEDLRKQIEDFYTNMGFQIDDSMRETINKLAEDMSVMVTVMQDVRGQFINIWRETGSSAGQAFISSMTPYMDAMLTNMSQLFYDVYFSDVTDMLNKEFKAISEKMVELKKQGANMKWSDVAGEIGSSFDKVVNSIISAKQNTESFNTVLIDLQKKALDAGLTLSEIFSLGLVSGTQKEVLESFKSAMNSSEMNGGLISIGNMVGDKVGDAITNKLMDNLFSSQMLQFSSKLDSVLSGNLNFSDLGDLMQDAMSIGMGIEEQRKKMEAIKDMFDFSQEVNYDANDESITYTSGVSQSVVNNYYISSNIEAGNVIESDSLERLVDAIADDLVVKFRDRGYNL